MRPSLSVRRIGSATVSSTQYRRRRSRRGPSCANAARAPSRPSFSPKTLREPCDVAVELARPRRDQQEARGRRWPDAARVERNRVETARAERARRRDVGGQVDGADLTEHEDERIVRIAQVELERGHGAVGEPHRSRREGAPRVRIDHDAQRALDAGVIGEPVEPGPHERVHVVVAQEQLAQRGPGRSVHRSPGPTERRGTHGRRALWSPIDMRA